MPVQSQAVYIEGLEEFRAAVRRAEVENPRLVSAALKRAGTPLVAASRAKMPALSGALRKSVKTSVRRTMGMIYSDSPYGGGAEWGIHGKWAGWVSRYGFVPRFVYPTVEEMQPITAELIYQGLHDVVSIYGWGH